MSLFWYWLPIVVGSIASVAAALLQYVKDEAPKPTGLDGDA
jgi:hypothetical protein